MKRQQSGVKAASEKQQTDAHHGEDEGERWWRRKGETDGQRKAPGGGQPGLNRQNTPETTRADTIGKVRGSEETLMQPYIENNRRMETRGDTMSRL